MYMTQGTQLNMHMNTIHQYYTIFDPIVFVPHPP